MFIFAKGIKFNIEKFRWTIYWHMFQKWKKHIDITGLKNIDYSPFSSRNLTGKTSTRQSSRKVENAVFHQKKQLTITVFGILIEFEKQIDSFQKDFLINFNLQQLEYSIWLFSY